MCDELLAEVDQDLFNWNDNIFGQESGHFSSAEDVHQNPSSSFDVGFGFRSPDESSSKKIKISPFNQQEEEESSLLGLKLNKSPSLISLLERKLSQGRKINNTPPTKSACKCDNKKLTSDDFVSQPMSEKLKASNFPAMLLKIGSSERKSIHEGDLVAKCYYAKRKLVWEVLEGALKSKIEVQWSHIIGIRATILDDKPPTLEIELLQPPSFFRETNPQPRKHTLWQPAQDFTGGQALICRRHYVIFAPGSLDKHYEKLLQYDQRLLHLSQKPFPSLESPYFDVNTYGLPEFSLGFNGYGPQFFPGLQCPHQTFPALPSPHVHQNLRQATRPPLRIMNSNSPMSGNVSNFMLEDQRRLFWSEANFAKGNHIQQTRPFVTQVVHGNSDFPSHIDNLTAYEEFRRKSNADMSFLSDIENHLLGEGENNQMVCSSDENIIAARMRSMYPLLDPQENISAARMRSMYPLLDPQELMNPMNDQMILNSTIPEGLLNPMRDQMIVQGNSTIPGGLVCSEEANELDIPRF